MSENELELIKKNSDTVIQECRPLSEIDFGLDSASVEWLEGYIERLRSSEEFNAETISRLVSVFGSFWANVLSLMQAANGGDQMRVPGASSFQMVTPLTRLQKSEKPLITGWLAAIQF